MTMIFDEKVHSIYNASMPDMKPHGADWLATIRETTTGDYELIYRFRYYMDDKAFDSEDKKSWYKAECPQARIESLVASTLRVMHLAQTVWGGKGCVLNRADFESFDAFRDAFQALPFIHLQLVN